jgi:DNA-binding NtrC family response regulator
MPAILIVDDEKNIRAHLASYLRGLGYTAETAASGTDALTLMRDRRFDLVLSDVRMTGMDGLALLAELKRNAPEASVILMTAYATVRKRSKPCAPERRTTSSNRSRSKR